MESKVNPGNLKVIMNLKIFQDLVNVNLPTFSHRNTILGKYAQFDDYSKNFILIYLLVIFCLKFARATQPGEFKYQFSGLKWKSFLLCL